MEKSIHEVRSSKTLNVVQTFEQSCDGALTSNLNRSKNSESIIDSITHFVQGNFFLRFQFQFRFQIKSWIIPEWISILEPCITDPDIIFPVLQANWPNEAVERAVFDNCLKLWSLEGPCLPWSVMVITWDHIGVIPPLFHSVAHYPSEIMLPYKFCSPDRSSYFCLCPYYPMFLWSCLKLESCFNGALYRLSALSDPGNYWFRKIRLKF